jgi:molybdopterin-guanine dinucleotide biosynthesis protein A
MPSEPPAGLAAVVLAGGRSSRMGTPKALLEWHGVPLLGRVTALLGRVAAPVVVVHAASQELPALPAAAERVADAYPGRGPLEGMAAGLHAVGGRAGMVFLAAVDLPLLHPEFVRALAGRVEGADAAVPVAEGHDQPLAAVYRTAVLEQVERRLATGQMSMNGLLDDLAVRRVPASSLPHPESVRNVNAPHELAAALAEPAPLVRVATADGAGRTVRAATLGAALGAGDRARRTVALNGVPLDAVEPDLPLVDGDALELGLRIA